MAHIVTCYYCKNKFDRDRHPFIQVSSRRYAHKDCSEKAQEEISQEEKDKQELEKYIMSLLKEDYISPRVRKQIKDYKDNYNYTYSGMRKALVYFYEVKGNPTEKANGGIGIIPYVYKDAFYYYRAIWEANKKNEKKVVQDTSVIDEKIVVITPPERKIKKPKRFAFLDEEENIE